MDATVQKWGNSLALRIPKSVAQDLGLQQGSPVELEAAEGRLIVKPKKGRKQSLAQLLKGVTKGNVHAEVDWGPAQGREVW